MQDQVNQKEMIANSEKVVLRGFTFEELLNKLKVASPQQLNELVSESGLIRIMEQGD